MAPLVLTYLKGNTYYIPAPTNVGIYLVQNQAYLIDSGNDKEAGRQILKLINEQGWQLKGIINTHSNADHIGGNAYLQEKTGCQIMASGLEAPFISFPELEPAFLFGGFPTQEMRNKFLLAKKSRVDKIIPSEGVVEEPDIRTISLPGHYFDMIGIVTPDNVCFLADSLMPERIIQKYHLFFLYDIKQHLLTLERLETLEAELFVPSHGEPYLELTDIVQINRGKILEIIERILGILKEPMTREDILQAVCEAYEIALNSTQYVLLHSTISSYLSYLHEQGLIQNVFSSSQMLWAKK